MGQHITRLESYYQWLIYESYPHLRVNRNWTLFLLFILCWWEVAVVAKLDMIGLLVHMSTEHKKVNRATFRKYQGFDGWVYSMNILATMTWYCGTQCVVRYIRYFDENWVYNSYGHLTVLNVQSTLSHHTCIV